MNEVMSRKELEVLYPNEWILMVDPEPGWDINYRGRVVAHSPDRAEVLRKGMELPAPRHVAVFFTGPPIPPGMRVLGLTPRGYVAAVPPLRTEKSNEG
jgi:hypothetical protein